MRSRARESSLFVPGPYSNSFVFLSIFGPAAPKLRKTRFHIDEGIVGKVYRDGLPHLSKDVSADKEFSSLADQKSGHVTRGMVAVPVSYGGQVTGVLQFLNKEGDGAFTSDDLGYAVKAASVIGPRVAEFLRDSRNFESLGLSSGTGKLAAIVVCDLTSSSRLFETMEPPIVVDTINEYLERQVEIAFRNDMAVDKYAGDGAMLSYNLGRPVADVPPIKLVMTALEMQADFEHLKASWLDLGLGVDFLHSRISIATGYVMSPVMGHPRFPQLTIFGEVVGRSAHLSEIAPKDRSTVVVDAELAASISDIFEVEQTSAAAGPARPAVYEVRSMRSVSVPR